MPYSMTGFASIKQQFENYDIDIKIKSLNSKALDLSVKGDRSIQNFLELEIKKLAQQFFERGTISVVVNIDYKQPVINIDPEKLKTAVESFKNIFSFAGISPSDDKILDFCISYSQNFSEELDPQLKEDFLNTLKQAFTVLKEERKKEGDVLVSDISNRLNLILKLTDEIEQRKEEIIKTATEKLTAKVKQLLGEEFSERAFIEASLLAQKMDITEEIVRLKNHIQSFFELLSLDQPVGRKMDFLCQEMHREANTLGNKMPDFSKMVVEIKTQIEKIRQQVQNIE